MQSKLSLSRIIAIKKVIIKGKWNRKNIINIEVYKIHDAVLLYMQTKNNNHVTIPVQYPVLYSPL